MRTNRSLTPIPIHAEETAFALRAAPLFVVEDTGPGIPPDEIATVVEFGRRGSNVTDVRTMGGGFGLTKAFLVAKQFRGQSWIASKLDAGTRIRIALPRPAGVAQLEEAALQLGAA